MSSNLYEIYKANTLQLAKTLVIKSEASANALNAGLLEYQMSVDLTRPETWMYYLNLAGEYHEVNTMMTVLSLDTRETINFTKANLLEHRTTAREYTYGSTYYNELVRRYPDQTALIRGIINPVDIQMAISAPDHTILYYDNKLVEEWEDNLIPSLQRWIKSYMRRFYHADFALTEDLYTASNLAQMHYSMCLQIMLIRQRNCRTERVHSFHLWGYLGSHNYLDDYKDFLTREQAMWLYRDINYITHNWGKAETMETLIEWVLTKRQFPIGSYELYATDISLLETLYPTAELDFTPLNFKTEQDIRHDPKTVREILEKELPLARDNEDNLEYADKQINFDFTRGLMGEIPTKVLESEVIDISLLTPVRLVDTLYNHWIRLASAGKYTAIITVQNPKTGQKMIMSVKDAVVAFLYCLNKAFGVELTLVPKPEAWDVMRMDRVTFSQLRKLAEPYLVSNFLIRTAMDEMPALPRIVSTEGFYLKCVEIRETQLAHRELYSLREHHRARGQMEAVCRHLFETKQCSFAPDGTTMKDFFASRNWELEGFDDVTYQELATSIFTIATGSDLFYAKSLAEIHAAMLRLFMELSSYTIHAIQTINTNPAIVNDWRVIRVGDIWMYGLGNLRHPWTPAHVKNWQVHGSAAIDYELTKQGSQWSADVKSNAYIYLDTDLDFTLNGGSTLRIRVEAPLVRIRRSRPVELSTVIKKPNLDGLVDYVFTNTTGQTLSTKNLSGLDDPIIE